MVTLRFHARPSAPCVNQPAAADSAPAPSAAGGGVSREGPADNGADSCHAKVAVVAHNEAAGSGSVSAVANDHAGPRSVSAAANDHAGPGSVSAAANEHAGSRSVSVAANDCAGLKGLSAAAKAW